MYAIIDKKSKQVLFTHPGAGSQEMTGEQVHPGFDAATMLLLTYDGDRLPKHYKVSKTGAVTALNLSEKLAKRVLFFGPDFLNEIVADLSPDSSQVLQAVQIALDNDLIQTETHCTIALAMISQDIEREIAAQYPQSAESKIMKGCLEWLMEDRPADDPRAAAYHAMKATIEAIKARYQAAKARVKVIMSKIQ